MNCTISESSKFWTHIALPGICLVVCLVECPWTQLGLRCGEPEYDVAGNMGTSTGPCPSLVQVCGPDFTVNEDNLHTTFLGFGAWLQSLSYIDRKPTFGKCTACTLGWCAAPVVKWAANLCIFHLWKPCGPRLCMYYIIIYTCAHLVFYNRISAQ